MIQRPDAEAGDQAPGYATGKGVPQSHIQLRGPLAFQHALRQREYHSAK